MSDGIEKTIKIDGVDYKLSELTDAAKNQVLNLQVTDQEIVRLKQRLSIAQTARAAYANALKAEMPQPLHN